jgi:hypothetical protein
MSYSVRLELAYGFINNLELLGLLSAEEQCSEIREVIKAGLPSTAEG